MNKSLLYNFVADDKTKCETSIDSTSLALQNYALTAKASNDQLICSVGGGCGLDCGIPGPSCPSANPNLWGACIEYRALSAGTLASAATPAPTVVATPSPAPFTPINNDVGNYHNFVADDQATCEAAIVNHLGTGSWVPKTCTIGGGCGVTCEKPGPNCPSAYPKKWGACIIKTA
jgi:hypothetical protein